MLLWVLLACGERNEVDADRDGWTAARDCDDADPFVHPGANEFCDGRDDDCDGRVDAPEPLGQQTWYADLDGDRFGDPFGDTTFGCAPGPGWSIQATDCDDTNPERFPGVPDRCNAVDDDCDDRIDEDPGERFLDADGDGHGDPLQPVQACDGASDLADDCDDTLPTVFAGAPEVCDGFDSDCDGLGDELDQTTEVFTWWPDTDGDGFGIEAASIEACVPPNERFATALGDCDDLDPLAFPGAPQLCTSRDTNCDGLPGDEGSWWDPAWPHRIVLTASGGDKSVPAEVAVDFRAALDSLGSAAAFDPAGLVAVVQDCGGDGGVPLPTAFVDGLAALRGPGEPEDPLGDEHGLVTFVLDRPATALALYFGGPPVAATGTASATATSITSGAVSATFDPDLAGLVDELSVGATRVGSQANARDGNGVQRYGEWTTLGTGSATVLAAGPVFSAVSYDGEYEGTSGTVRYAWWWFTWSGSPVVFGRVVLEGATEVHWDYPGDWRLAVRPLEMVPLDRGPVTGSTVDGWAVHADGSAGYGLGWVTPPVDASFLQCDDTSCFAAGSEGQGSAGYAAAGARIVDQRVLGMSPFTGSTLPGGTPDLARAKPAVIVGAAESLH